MQKNVLAKHKNSIFMFFLLLIFWVIIDGQVTVESLIIGSIGAIAIIILNKNMLFTSKDGGPITLKSAWHFIVLIFHLIIEIIESNILVAKIVLSPKMPIDPSFVKIPVKPKKEFTKFLYGNSINITPGSLVIEVTEDYYLVHVLNKHSADGLYQNKLEKYVLRLEVEKS